MQGYLKWLSLSMSRFHESDREYRDKALAMREALAKLMTPAEIAEAERPRAGLESQMKAGSGGLLASSRKRKGDLLRCARSSSSFCCSRHRLARAQSPEQGLSRCARPDWCRFGREGQIG